MKISIRVHEDVKFPESGGTLAKTGMWIAAATLGEEVGNTDVETTHANPYDAAIMAVNALRVLGLDAALEAKYPEPEPEPVNEPFRPYFSGAIQRGGQYNIAVRYSQYGEVVTYSIEDILAALDTHEAVKAWEAAARKADTEPFWYACRKGGIATRQYDTILAALIAEFGGEAALEGRK